MYVVLKTIHGTTWMAVGPFKTRADAVLYAARCTDSVCPAGEKWEVQQLAAPTMAGFSPAI